MIARTPTDTQEEDMPRLFPQIDTPHRQVYRDMIWRELFRYGEAGATPAGLAANLIPARD
jgi:hypothetical protein